MGQEQSSTRRHQYPSGNVYEGGWKRNKRNGKGTMWWTDGTEYSGDWVNNKQEGYGTMKFRNGNVYEGNFSDNNFSGNGTLRTSNSEVISGNWHFLGRNNSNLTGQHSVIGTYRLNVTITDVSTNQTHGYSGDASVHLDTGLVVLPNMPKPDIALLPYAVAVAAYEDASHPTATAEPYLQADSFNMNAPQAAPGYPTAAGTGYAQPPSSGPGNATLGQPLLAGESYQGAATAPVAGSNSVAYGVSEPGMNLSRPTNQRGKVEVFNPRNYF